MADVDIMEVSLNVQWNGSFVLDNPDQLTGKPFIINILQDQNDTKFIEPLEAKSNNTHGVRRPL